MNGLYKDYYENGKIKLEVEMKDNQQQLMTLKLYDKKGQPISKKSSKDE